MGKGRWFVDVEGVGSKLIKPDNFKLAAVEERSFLRDGAWVKIRAPDAQNQLNGRRGRVQYEAEPGRWQVNIEGVGLKTLSVEYLRPTGKCGPQDMCNGQYYHLAGLDGN